MQAAQAAAGFGAELVDEDLAGALVGGQRLAGLAVVIEREHEQPVPPLAQRMSRGQLPQLGDDLGVTAQVQVGVDADLQRLQPQLGQGRAIPRGQQVGIHVGQRLASPQRQRLARHGGGVRPGRVPGRDPGGVQPRPEPGHV